MTCHHVPLPGGGHAIVCTRGERRRRCACGAIASLLCDWKRPNGRTCDAPICERCAVETGPDRHLCGAHAAVFPQGELF